MEEMFTVYCKLLGPYIGLIATAAYIVFIAIAAYHRC